ncbi:hypothetical protein G6F68_018985 [Rhizopus microsporus]|nr:hypothetical protein G6F68_018985 [Rhizopus microsporus]
MDTPFNVTSYTSELLTNRQAVTLADALNAEPSVRFTGQIGGVTDSFYIRGFPIGEGNLGEIAFDGVYGVAPNYHVFTDYIERRGGRGDQHGAQALAAAGPDARVR